MKVMISALLLFSVAAFAETVRSPQIRAIIAQEIESAEWVWSGGQSTDELGSIWHTPYVSDEGDDNGHPESYEFDVTKSIDRDGDGAADILNVTVSVPCGTEYDESELSGTCEVTAKKSAGKWSAQVKSCECESN